MIHLHRFEDEPVDEPYTLLKKTKCRRFAQLEAGAYEVYRRGKNSSLHQLIVITRSNKKNTHPCTRNNFFNMQKDARESVVIIHI